MDNKPLAENSPRGRTLGILILLIVLVLGIGIGTVISTKVGAERKPLQAGNAQPISFSGNSVPLQGFSEVAKVIEPAVVNISTQAVLQAKSGRRGSGSGSGKQRKPPAESPFDWLDPDLLDRFGFGGPSQPQKVTSLGSGIIVDVNGHIITNYHVI